MGIHVYLTPTGAASTTSGGATYFRLSYNNDIFTWLTTVSDQIAASRVRDTVAQYCHLIQQL